MAVAVLDVSRFSLDDYFASSFTHFSPASTFLLLLLLEQSLDFVVVVVFDVVVLIVFVVEVVTVAWRSLIFVGIVCYLNPSPSISSEPTFSNFSLLMRQIHCSSRFASLNSIGNFESSTLPHRLHNNRHAELNKVSASMGRMEWIDDISTGVNEN